MASNSKALSLILLGLALCCGFFQSAAAQENACTLNFTDHNTWGVIPGEGNLTAPFNGWYLLPPPYRASNESQRLYSVDSVSPVNCELCTLRIFKTNAFGGLTEFYDFRNASVYQPKIVFPFRAKSYTLQCFPEVPEFEEEEEEFSEEIQEPEEEEEVEPEFEEEEEEFSEEIQEPEEEEEVEPEEEEEEELHEEESQEEVEEEEIAEEEEEESVEEYRDVVWGQIIENENEPLPQQLLELRNDALLQAANELQAKGTLPEGQYSVSKTYVTEFSENYHILYRFNAQVTSDTGVQYRISATVLTDLSYLENYQLIDYAYIENRLAEFGSLTFEKEGEGQVPLPEDEDGLRTRSVQQAVDRLQVKGVLPKGDYTITQIFDTEFADFDHPEFPPSGMGPSSLYRFNVQVTNESGVRFRLAVIIVHSNNIPSHYELIDYTYVENRLGEFNITSDHWREIANGEERPLTDDQAQLRTRAVLQAVGRLQAKGVLPQGNYTITQDFITEFTGGLNHSEYPLEDSYGLHKFNVQVTHESGVRFRLVVTTITADYIGLSYYELIDYVYVENRLGEFVDPDWRPMNGLPDDVDQLKVKAVNQALGRLQAKGILPQDNYTITQTYTTEFNARINHPEFSQEQGQNYIIYRFNVQVTNDAGVRFRIQAVTISSYDTPLNYELIDYSYVEKRLAEFSKVNFRTINEDDLRTKAIAQAVDRLKAEGVLPEGQYPITKTYPTEYSAGYENPDYPLEDGKVLWRFTAEVGSKVKVYVVVLTDYAAPLNYELIDFGKAQ